MDLAKGKAKSPEDGKSGSKSPKKSPVDKKGDLKGTDTPTNSKVTPSKRASANANDEKRIKTSPPINDTDKEMAVNNSSAKVCYP